MIRTDKHIDSNCFYCHRPLNPTHFIWYGENGEIRLHLTCALAFSSRMGATVRRILNKGLSAQMQEGE